MTFTIKQLADIIVWYFLDESGKRIVQSIIEKSAFLRDSPDGPVDQSVSKIKVLLILLFIKSFKVKLINKANKNYTNHSNSILEVVTEDKELNQDYDNTNRMLNLDDDAVADNAVADNAENRLKRAKKKKNTHKL